MVGIKTDAPSLALVGVGGFGPVHIANIHRLAQAGQAQLAALISGGGLARLGETVPANIAAFAASVPGYPTLDDYLADGSVADIVVLCTPIHTHVPLAIAAMKAGANVLLEKPPTPSLADFERLLGVASDTGQAIQVGFQSFGSQALPALAAIIEDGVLGEVIGVGAVGTWSRSVAYFTRSSWAGKRTLDGVPVCDGVVTNPLAHAVATALKIAGATRLGDLASVDLDLYRANDIDCDDTSALRCVTKGGVTVGLGLTLAADEQASPYVTVRGTKGRATLFYADDLLKLAIQGQPETSETYGRTDLTENLIDHLRDPSVSLLCPLDEIGAFTTVLDTVASSADPRRIPGSFLSRLERDGATWVVVPKVDHWCRQVAEEAKTFAELGAPWVGAQRVIMDINFDGETVGRYVDGLDASALDCPRPHFHPLTTLGGVIVTDDSPPDHS
ncbi:MAG: Gfo/Idh/MocA family oxidoreductase, partial [Propionibacteriaceae bacterium]|nr:Gfo/Idh/MocA family oxidoreductase [Propionibacteriaceae bacterium]